MKIRRTIAAAITAAAVMSSLTACGKDEPSAVNSGGGAGNTLTSDIIQYDKSKVTTCDSTANMFVIVSKTYFADYINNGGAVTSTDGIAAEITVTKGAASVKMNGYNDAAITDKIGTYENFVKESLSFEDNVSGKAVIYANKEGKPYAAIYSESMDAVFGTYSYTDDGKIIPSFSWRSEKEPGVTPEGHIVGTYPKVSGIGTTLA